jgi:hypothetical protein
MKIYTHNIKTNKHVKTDLISISAKPSELRRLARFLLQSANSIAKDKGNFGHAHLQDFRRGKNERMPDVIVVSLKQETHTPPAP